MELGKRNHSYCSKYKGFTLIELLAIIVILAIIAVITVPVILNIIDRAKQGSAKNSALGYIDAVKKQIVINNMDDNSSNDVREGTIKSGVLESTYGVKVDGEKPLNDSTVDFNNGGVVGYKLYIGGYIVTMLNDVATVVKNSDSNVAVESITGLDAITMTVGEERTITASVLPTNATNKALTYTGYNTNIITISNGKITGVAPGNTTITVTSVDGNFTDTITVNVKEKYIMSISDDCAKAGNGPCDITKIRTGVSMDVKVNSTTTETFNVIADDGNILTLQMNSNIASGSGTEWYTTQEGSFSNLYGPIIALKTLHSLTSGWTNVLPMNFTYEEKDANGNYYEKGYRSAIWLDGVLTVTQNSGSTVKPNEENIMRARMITAQEVASLISDDGWNIGYYTGKNDTTPDWMKLGLRATGSDTSKPKGYWTLTSFNPTSGDGKAWYLDSLGCLGSDLTNYPNNGVRAVIYIPKDDVI